MSENISTPSTIASTPASAPYQPPTLPAPQVKPVSPAPFTPMAHRLSMRPREIAKQAIVDLKPDGNPKPELVEIAKDAIDKMIDLHGKEYQGMEIVCEIGGGLAHQINIIVIPHKW